MNSTPKKVITLAVVALVSAAVAAGAAWRFMQPAAATSAAAAPKKEKEKAKLPPRYVTLDKVIVMLRRSPNEASAHYLAADLVLATTDEKEKTAKEHLPMLRSVAVSALSTFSMPSAADMTVEQYASVLNKSFEASYAKARLEKPFNEVLISKLIIE
jgi:flagellar FliL protein